MPRWLELVQLSASAVRIAPSVLSADFARMAEEIARIEAVADMVHLDVMDGHFVPNLTFGLPMVKAVVESSTLPADVHLMISDPDRWAPAYAEAGAASVTFHAEAVSAPVRLARTIRAAGARAGIGLNPATPVDAYADLLAEFDMVLVMSVEPGFGGQSFIDQVLVKVRRTRALIRDGGHSVAVQMDGGVDEDTIARCVEAGADVIVAGSAVYSADDPAVAVKRLAELGNSAVAQAWWRA